METPLITETKKSEIPSSIPSQPKLSPLFNRYGLDKIFTNEKYTEIQKTKNHEEKKFGLHYLIALNQKIESITKFLEENTSQKVNTAYLSNGLTPLQLAVIKGNIPVINLLLQKEAKINAKDSYGFTAWHHTTLLTNEVIIKKLLEEKGAIQDSEAWNKLRVKAGFEITKASSLGKTYYKIGEEAPQLIQDDAEFLKKYLNIEQLTDEILFPENVHQYLWKTHFKTSTDEDLIPITDFTPPRLCILAPPYLSNLSQKNKALYAIDKIEKGKFIGYYSGIAELIVNRKFELDDEFFNAQYQDFILLLKGITSNRDYGLNIADSISLNAEHIGNAMRFANDGWPVCILRMIKNISAFMSLENIEGGKEITWDYGAGCCNVKWGNYRLIYIKEMIDFFKKDKLLGNIQNIDKLDEGNYIDSTYYWSKIQFIFNTPLALIYLCLNDILPIQECVCLLSQKTLKKKVFAVFDYPIHYLWIANVLALLEKIKKSTEKNNKLNSKIISYFNSKILNQFSVTQVAKILDELKNHLTNNEVDFFNTDWANKLKDYCWESDNGKILGVLKIEEYKGAKTFSYCLTQDTYNILGSLNLTKLLEGVGKIIYST